MKGAEGLIGGKLYFFTDRGLFEIDENGVTRRVDEPMPQSVTFRVLPIDNEGENP